MADHVFICYARKDQDFVLKLAANLKKRGVPIWIDQWDIPPTADWDLTIDNALYDCAQFLIVLSPAAVGRREVRGELRTALDEDKPIVPLLYKKCRIPRQLRMIQHIDFTTRGPDDAGALSETLRALGVAQPARTKPARARPVPKRPTPSVQKKVRDKPKKRVEAEPEFYEQPVWWASLVVLILVSVAGAFLANALLRWSLGLFGVELPKIAGGWLALSIGGLVWGFAYAFVGAIDAIDSTDFFFPFLVPYDDIFGPYEFGDLIRGLLTALPINFLISWGVANGLTIATTELLGASDAVVYLAFGLLTLIELGVYLSNV